MTHELHTNDEPQRVLLEASERIKACYPPGTMVEMQFGDNRVTGAVCYMGLGLFVIVRDNVKYAFDPATNPHRVLP